MQTTNLKIVKMFDDVKTPVKANATDSGFDVFSYSVKRYYHHSGSNGERVYEGEQLRQYVRDHQIELQCNERVLIGTGIKATVGEGYEIQVRSRSGLALKQGLVVLNSPGTIDSSYTKDEIGIIISNTSRAVQIIKLGERIAQLVPMKVELLELEIVKDLGEVDRGGGFGHTGNK